MWRVLLNWLGFGRAAAPTVEPAVDPEAAYRAKRTAQRREQRARAKAKKAALSVSPTVAGVTATCRQVSPDVGDTPKTLDKSQQLKNEQPPLSLIENKNLPREREAIPLPEDFTPDEKSLATAIEQSVDPAALTANFREHYLARPHDMRTPAAWQATYRKWARSERRKAQSPQGEMRLIRKAHDDTDRLWKFNRSKEETLARRREDEQRRISVGPKT
jgi:hypothetical protein